MCLPVDTEVQKEWEYKGLKCAITKNRLQAYCAYVRVPPGHPFHGKEYSEIEVDCHGGLTFAELEPCEHEDGCGWWIGMDFAHGEDYVPGFAEALLTVKGLISDTFRGKKWALEEVVAETNDLARQVIEVL